MTEHAQPKQAVLKQYEFDQNGNIHFPGYAATDILIRPHEMVWTPTGFTRGLAEVLSKENLKGKNVIDFACGGGMLGIVAGMNDAAQVTALDLNPYAGEVMQENWALNGLPPERMNFMESDCFSAIDSPEHYGKYDLLVCNPPTLPMKPDTDPNNREGAMAWNEVRDPDGRTVLDAALLQGYKFLQPTGTMLIIATSTEGWRKTVAYLDQNWEWGVDKTLDLPLDSDYDKYIDAWRKEGGERMIETPEGLFQRLYFVRAHPKVNTHY